MSSHRCQSSFVKQCLQIFRSHFLKHVLTTDKYCLYDGSFGIGPALPRVFGVRPRTYQGDCGIIYRILIPEMHLSPVSPAPPQDTEALQIKRSHQLVCTGRQGKVSSISYHRLSRLRDSSQDQSETSGVLCAEVTLTLLLVSLPRFLCPSFYYTRTICGGYHSRFRLYK